VHVLRVIYRTAGHVGQDALKKHYPDVSRSLLRGLLERVRRRLRAKRRKSLLRLHWTWPGTVWAMDFTALDGRSGGHALCVRDLGSTRVLHAGLVDGESSAEVALVLASLFAAHGPPLVMKMDNGAAFVSERTVALLRVSDVMPLYSPPRTPQYNGSCEVGNGRIKRIAEDLRLLDDPEAPLADYVDPALDVMDQQLVGRGARALSRLELWQRRRKLTPELRRELRESYRKHEADRREAQGIAKGAALGHAEQASLDRYAIRDALCEMKLLKIRRR
jgi:hypothetical protein